MNEKNGKTVEELRKLSEVTTEKVNREKPRKISSTTLMEMMGIEVIDHTVPKTNEYNENYIS